jgi:4-carboxymuconolactone decarboxylase
MMKTPIRVCAAVLWAIPLASLARAEPSGSMASPAMQAITPDLAHYTNDVLYGDIWKRPNLSPRDRSLVTVAALIATGKTTALPEQIRRALDNGVRPSEIAGAITHLAFYCGWPNAASALAVVEQVFHQRGITAAALRQNSTRLLPVPPSDAVRTKLVNDHVAPVSPKLAALTNDALFGDIWRRPDLTPRDRSLLTIAALAADGDDDQLSFHIGRGLENGLTRDQIGEVMTQLAFYVGWPKTLAAVAVAAKVFDRHNPAPTVATPGGDPVRIFRLAPQPTQAPAGNFTGTAMLDAPFQAEGGSPLIGATVSFQAGVRSHWHTHPHGQLLIVTSGHGWVQAEGSPVHEIEAGDVVSIPPGVKHWHGATATSGMTHVAIAASGQDGQSVHWLEAVADAQYHGPQ